MASYLSILDNFCPFSFFLFVSSAVSYTKMMRKGSMKEDVCPEELQNDAHENIVAAVTDSKHATPFPVVFVLGGPGSGKGTQCSLLSLKLGWHHLSAGDLLRAERKSGSDLADIINSKITAGEIVPAAITVNLLRKSMEEIDKTKEKNSKNVTKFLIDGFPRDEGNVKVWKEQIGDSCKIEFVLFLDCPEDVMTGRLLERGETSGRNDDNLETIRKRFRTFHEESMPIVDLYETVGKVRKVLADKSVEDVYKEVEALFDDL